MSNAPTQTRRPSAGATPYVGGVILVGIAAGVALLARPPIPDLGALLLWCTAFLVGEMMVLKTPTGSGNVSMASALHLAAIPLLGAPHLFLTAWTSRLLANLVFQRQRWYKALFNASQVSLAVVGAALCYEFAGGAHPVVIDRSSLFHVLPAMAAGAVAYYAVNLGLVCGVLALTTGSAYLDVWRENYGYRVELVSSIALFLLAPMVTISYQNAGLIGLIVFLLPMLFIRDACERYIALERTHQALIGSERLAAKGEMAASVGHELNNYLAVLSGNLQIVHMKLDAMTPEELRARIQKSHEQLARMTTLSKGLMNFSHLDSRLAPTDLGELVKETVEFVRPQNRFDDTVMAVECEPGLSPLLLDPAQIQQVLMNLLNNAADAMNDAGSPRRRIDVRLVRHEDETALILSVEDTGPGVPDELRQRIFDPSFTTKETGHGFGLSTVYRIIQNHGGTIVADRSAAGGASFRIELPVRTGSRRSRAA